MKLLLIKQKNLFNGRIKKYSNVMGQFQGRIVLVFFQEDDGFPPDIDFFSQIVLRQVELCPQFPDPVIHFGFL